VTAPLGKSAGPEGVRVQTIHWDGVPYIQILVGDQPVLDLTCADALMLASRLIAEARPALGSQEYWPNRRRRSF
jgi:hypothetical protein